MLVKETLLVPFNRLRLSDGKKEWTIMVESHFICKIPPEERILLVSMDKGEPKSSLTGKMLKPCIENGYEALEFLLEGLKKTKEQSFPPKKDKRKEGFAGKFLLSEMRRLFFGGFASTPPSPDVSSWRKNMFLVELYKIAIGGNPESTRILSSRLVAIPFVYFRDEKKLLARDTRYGSFERILNKLLSNGKISL